MWYLKISLFVIFTINLILRLSKAITTDGCSQTIGCLRVPSKCELSKCNYLATYKRQGNQVTFELLGKGAGWVSIGFSNDQDMPSTDAVFCYNNNSKVEIRSGKLIGQRLPKLQKEKELVFINGSTLGGRSIQCRFLHPLKPNKLSNLRNLEESVFLLYALGDQSSDNVPSYHGFGASKRGSSATRVNITQMDDPKATSPSDLKRIHGSLMVIVWIFLASIGLFFARYTRNIWPDIKLLDNKVWFQFHRSLMIIVVLGTISSIVVIFVDLKGRFTKGKDKIKIHAILGLVVFVLAILQPIGALFRPHPGASKRPIFNFIHRLLGLSAFIISLAAIVLGLDIFEKKEASHAVLGYVGFLGLVILIMEIIKFYSWKRNEEETGAGVIPGGMEMQTSIAETNTTHLTFSKNFLGTLIVVSLAVAVVVIYYINKTDD